MLVVLRILAFILIVGFLLLVLAGQAGLLRGKPKGELGVKDGKLQRPSRTPNSVTSQADLWPDHPMRDYARIEPIRYTGSGTQALAKLQSILSRMPRTQIITADSTYVYAQCTTAMLRFTDDLELYLSESEGVIHVRSASRLGRKDFGVNRKRVEALRAAFSAS